MSIAFDKILHQQFQKTLASFYYCVNITLQNSKELYFTNKSSRFSMNGVEYIPNPGLKIIKTHLGEGGKDYLELSLFINYGHLEEGDMLEDATFKILLFFPGEKLLHPFFSMKVTSAKYSNLNAYLVLEPIATKLDNNILNCYSKTCRASLGDRQCKINLNNYLHRLAIEEIIGKNIILKETLKDNDYFNNGVIIIQSQNLEFRSTITSCDNNKILLHKAVPSSLSTVSYADFIAGCDKKFTTCCDKFNNAINFRGEPFIPVNKII